MTITKKFVENLGSMYGKKPYSDGMNWFIANFPSGGEHEYIFKKSIEDEVFSYPAWALSCSMSNTQALKWAIYCARAVLHIFEEKYPDDHRPRKAIEAAEAYLANPCEETLWAVRCVMGCAWESARDAWNVREVVDASVRAADAAESAADAAESAADAPDSAKSVAWAAWAAAWATAESAAKADPTLALDLLREGFRIWKDS